MRIVLFVIWIVLGLCLFLAGCRASLRAVDLEASFEFRAVKQINAQPIEVYIDKTSNRTEPKAVE